ncbi:MAG TPA: pentapeptide repeat-containing protein [Asticcacaulis sp.]|nr:pentapeptide repeat-containing protein [Asticcacaulis sp.]
MSDSQTISKVQANPEVQAFEAAWWQAWRKQDFSWDGLAAQPGHDGHSLQDYWRGEADDLIAEPGTNRRWTRFHCPLVFADGTPSPKANWSETQWQAVQMAVKTRLARGSETEPCLLTGVVLDRLAEPEEVCRNDRDGDFWLVASGAYLRDGCDFTCGGFAGVAFNAAWFGGEAVFAGTRLQKADFTQATFREPAHFTDAVFVGATQFSRAVFCDWGYFHNAHFLGRPSPPGDPADFSGAWFCGELDFSEADFESEAVFNGAQFAGRTNFYGARFEDRALFDDIACLENIHFYKSAFVRRLTINNARFYGKANFEGVTDGDPIALSPQAIRLEALPGEDTVLAGELSPGTGPSPRSFLALPKLLARDAVFYQDANFSNRDLLSPSTFEGAQFHNTARFHGSQIHANVSFHNASFKDALEQTPGKLPPLPEELLRLRFCASNESDYKAWRKAYLARRSETLKSQFSANGFFDALEASYRTLKQMMEDRRDRIREGEFFTLELLARRKRKDVPWWERSFSWLYSTFADYGNSIFRPLMALLVSLLLFTWIYFQAAESQGVVASVGGGQIGHALSAFNFTWHNAFAPFSALNAGRSGNEDAWLDAVISGNEAFAITAKIVATFQSMLTLLLAFLFALAARRRFQIN